MKDAVEVKVDFIILIDRKRSRRDLNEEEKALLYGRKGVGNGFELDYLKLLPESKRRSEGGDKNVYLSGEKTLETKQAESDTTKSEKIDKLIIVKKFLGLLGRVSPINTRLDLTKNSSYQHLNERAAIGYQLGLIDESGTLGTDGEEEKVPLSLARKLALNMDTKVDITSNLNLDMGYNISSNFKESNGRPRETKNILWPKVGLSWTGLEKLGLIKRFIATSTLNVNFTRRRSINETFEKTSYIVSPNWVLIWKNSLNSTIAMSYSQENQNIKSQQMWNKSWSASINLRYDISGKKGLGIPLPFLGSKKVKFKSKLTSNLVIAYSSSEGYNSPAMTTLKVSPMFTYGFSKAVTGSLSMNYSRTAGGIFGYINQQVGVHATANVEF